MSAEQSAVKPGTVAESTSGAAATSEAETTQSIPETQTEANAAANPPETTVSAATETTDTTSQTLSGIDGFNVALDAQQKGRVEEAILAYKQILANAQNEAPLTKVQESVIHHNLSVLYLKRNESKLAQIENHLALKKNPGNTQARELKKENEQFKQNQIQIDRVWSNHPAVTIIPSEILFFALILILVGLYRSLSTHFKAKRIALIDNLETPSLPLLPRLLLVAAIPVVGLLGIQFYDQQRPRGLIINDSVEIAAAAGEQQAVITQVNSGTEVLVLRKAEVDGVPYLQIQSTNQFAGWTQARNIALY